MCPRRIMMPQLRAKRQRQLFDEAPAVPAVVRLPLEVQEQLRRGLVQWMQALAKRIREEDGDE
jgi:hypothetical protein